MPTPTTEAQLAAALAGRYDVERELGRGGMATVYLARDPRHSRRVAIKVLDPELAASLGAQRFLTEIRVTAALQHPNVLSLFDSGDANGLLYYVMPFVDGESLRQRLDRERQLPVRDSVHIAVGIAAALEHAHKAGVVHRDLKPENILLADGEPIVADFGIALAVRQAAEERVTLTGLSIGTPAYMSPEQATGDRTIDARSDIFALGCVLYEMLAGESPFAAPSSQAIIARIVTDTPRPLSVIRPSVPPYVAAAVDRALEKLPADRWASALEFSEALKGARTSEFIATTGRLAAIGIAPRRGWIPWAVGAAAFVAGIAVAARFAASRQSTPERSTLRIPIMTADSDRFQAGVSGIPFSLADDDHHVAYVGIGSEGASRIYVKDLETNTTRAVSAEGNVLQPAFSPDGQWVVYLDLAAGRLVKVRSDGSLSTTLSSSLSTDNAGMSWAKPDTIIASLGSRLEAVSVSSGAVKDLSSPDTSRGETAQWGPHVLNDRYVGYVATSSMGYAAHRIAILDRQTGKTTITPHNGTTLLGAVDDHVLWVMADGTVMAAPFDARRGVIGTPIAVLEGVLVRPGGAAKATMSRRGSLLYQPGFSKSELMLVDRHGAATPFVVGARAFNHPRWSPDATRVGVTIERPGGSDVWVIDARSKAMSRLTTTGRHDISGWSSDGSRVVFRSSFPLTLDWQRPDGSEPAEHLLETALQPIDGMISPDGKWIFYRVDNSGHRSIYYTSFAGEHTPHALAVGNFDNLDPQLSPDGKWLAYSSDESGRPEVYVRSFPNAGSRVQVSVSGGGESMWSADGRSLYYRAGRAMVQASLTESPSLAVTSRQTLFENGVLADYFHNDYDLSRDGEHFLMTQSVNRDEETLLIYGWESELRRAWGGRK